ncbi:DUF4123 domain-containing protein [Marinobacter sp. MDS2]|uniref:DUF4123 domain-containing protein n=1 Tax=Marinobacter sp. MDS2 TaxID=3065961 RepID=UPI00273A9B63|nr:DUF4123 domain-containing protein [Marinobacter sp. MDS2]MDP4547703.1 DUF4123 domain-containing protein [Marinobacter sp. MDS2]
MFDVFERPSKNTTQVQDIHCNYVLIDGSKREEAERWLYELVDSPDYRNLYDGTEWAPIRSISPLLVRTSQSHPLLERLSLEGRMKEWGYAIDSDEPMDALADHLRRFITVRHPVGYSVMLRFADPTVARVLLASSGDGGVSEYWAPLTAVKLPDALWDDWHLQVRPDWLSEVGVGRSAESSAPFRLGELTLSGLTDTDRRATLVKLMQHLETYFPSRVASKARQGVVEDLRAIMEQALANGYESQQALLHWSTVYGYMGELSLWETAASSIHDLFHRWPGTAAEAQAREAAMIAMSSAETQEQGEPIHG